MMTLNLRFLPRSCISLLLASLVSGSALAADTLADIQRRLAKDIPGLTADQVRPSPVPGIYEINVGQQYAYVTADGRYLFAGDLTDMKTGREITEERRRDGRAEVLSQFGPSDYIEYAPPPPIPAEHVVTIFTDIDCGYCRKLHRQMADYNGNGIAIRYLFFPRSGLGTESHRKAEAVMCAADRQAALDKAKAGVNVGGKSCSTSLSKQYRVAQELGLRGTPMMILPDGEVINGYIPPQSLALRLQNSPMADPIPGVN